MDVVESRAELLQSKENFKKQIITIETPKHREREKWNNKLDFFFSGLGYAVGLSNVWRFPYLVYANGGGAFLLAYYIGVAIGGIPMFFLEICVGQYMSYGGPKAWNISPLFKGIGYAAAIMAFWSNLYYIVLMAWSLYYMVHSFQTILPWASCDNSWNTKYCINPFMNLSSELSHNEIDKHLLKSSVDEFWQLNVLQQTDSFGEIGVIRWELALYLFIAWLAVYFCIFKGVKWTGKVVYFTSTFPFIILIIILIRGLTLDGAWDGIRYLFKTDWNKLRSSETWIKAFTQAFYSYGVGLGAITTLGSYNKFKKNNYKEVLGLSFLSELTCMISGFAIFSVLGFLAKITGKDISEVADGGPGLAFVAYPSAISEMPLAPLWSVLFFVMLIFVALDGQFVCVEGFIAVIEDEKPYLRKKRKQFLGFICALSYIIGLIFVTQGGIYWFEIFNTFSCAGWAMLSIMIFECIAISWGYGVNKFYENVRTMIGFYPGVYWKYCWSVITPGSCILVFAFSIIKSEPFKYKDYVYPWYGEMIGWAIAFSSVSMIPIYGVYKIITNCGNLKEIVRPKVTSADERVSFDSSAENV